MWGSMLGCRGDVRKGRGAGQVWESVLGCGGE